FGALQTVIRHCPTRRDLLSCPENIHSNLKAAETFGICDTIANLLQL
ncbi:unnamed protein product, partial [Allacma fusca]